MLIIALFAAGCLPKELGDLVNLTVLNVSGNRLTGPLSIRSERFIFATEIDVAFYAGPLPKVLPISLEVFNLGDGLRNTNKFTGGIPSEWGALTNLKELKIVACGLDGKPLRTRTERLHVLLTFQLFGRRIAQGARQFDQFDPFLRLQKFSVRCAQHPSYHLEFPPNKSCFCAVSDAEKAALKAKLPNCRIYF